MTASTFAPGPQPLRRAAAPRPVSPPRPQLRLVGEPLPRPRRVTRLVTVALVVATFATLFAIVALRVLLAQGQVEVDRLTESIEARQAAQQDLRMTVAELEAPAQVVAAARQRLGMVTPVVVTYLTPLPPAGAATR
jgi:cell division protein FtsL